MSYTEKMHKSHTKNPMTRRDYELIASILKLRMRDAKDRVRTAQESVAYDFANGLAHMPGFDRARFLKACDVERIGRTCLRVK